MGKVNRVTSFVVLVSFLFNAFLFDTGFAQELRTANNSATLAVAKPTDDILGVEKQDITAISMVFMGFITAMHETGLAVTPDTLKNPNGVNTKKIDNIPGKQIYRHEAVLDPETGVLSLSARCDGRRYRIELRISGNVLHMRVYPEGKAIPQFVPTELIVPAEAKQTATFLTQEEATARLDALPTIGSIAALKAYYDMAIKSGSDHTKVLRDLKPELDQMADILRNTRPVDELNGLLGKQDLDIKVKQLDILRAVSELVLQFLPEKKNVDNIQRLKEIKTIFAKYPEISRLFIKYFETRFNPAKSLHERGENAGNIRIELLDMIDKINGKEDHRVLFYALSIMVATTKTDYYVKDKTCLTLRMTPRALVMLDRTKTMVRTPPYAMIWVHVPYGAYGAHSRYSDVARGGLRSVRPERTQLRNKILSECIALSFTQNNKHTDIPEGGSKGAYIYEEGLNPVAASIGYADGLINCMMSNEQMAVSSDGQVIDPLELGPDEGTADIGSLMTARAFWQGLQSWRLLITGKLQALGGTSHMKNNLLTPPETGNRVTSQGVMEHVFPLVRYLREKGVIKSKENEPIGFSVTSGFRGDVGSGLLEIAIRHYGNNAKMLTFGDTSAVVFDPEGLDHDALLKMYREELPTKDFPVDKLHKGGFVVKITKEGGASEENYVVLGPETLSRMNTKAFEPELLEKLGTEARFRGQAKLKPGERLVTVLKRDKNGHPTEVKVHSAYLRDVAFFVVKSDMLLTGGGVRDSINDNNWQLFFDWEGNPTVLSIVHGANVFISGQASRELEARGVVIEPDEKANSVGVEVSSRMEVDFNTIFDVDEIRPGLMKSFFGQVLSKCLENARKKFWALRIEAEDHPGESVVTHVSPRMSEEIIRLADLITGSGRGYGLVADSEGDYSQVVLDCLREYFPEVSHLDKKYKSTLARVFNRMPSVRIKAIASKLIAKEAVLNLGMGAVSRIAKAAGKSEIDVIEKYLEVAQRLNVNASIRKVLDNEESLSPGEQIKRLRELRGQGNREIELALRAANAVPASPAGAMRGIARVASEEQATATAAQNGNKGTLSKLASEVSPRGTSPSSEMKTSLDNETPIDAVAEIASLAESLGVFPDLLDEIGPKRKTLIYEYLKNSNTGFTQEISVWGFGRILSPDKYVYLEDGYIYGLIACLEAMRCWGKDAGTKENLLRVFLPVYEAVSNVYKHGRIGSIFIRSSASNALEVMCDDTNQVGMRDPEELRRLGEERGNQETGIGLPVIVRYPDECIFESWWKKWEKQADGTLKRTGLSNKGEGTRLTMRWTQPTPEERFKPDTETSKTVASSTSSMSSISPSTKSQNIKIHSGEELTDADFNKAAAFFVQEAKANGDVDINDDILARDIVIKYLKNKICNNEGGFLVALEEGEPVGIISYEFIPLLLQDQLGYDAVLQDLYVTSKNQHDGIGTTLVSNAKEVLRAKGARNFYVTIKKHQSAQNLGKKIIPPERQKFDEKELLCPVIVPLQKEITSAVATKGKGSPEELLQTIRDSDELMAKALNKKEGIVLENPETLTALGIFAPVENKPGYYRFADMMINESGDKDYTKTLINAIIGIRYKLHRSSIPEANLSIMRQLIKMAIINEINKSLATPDGKTVWHIIEKGVIPRAQQDSLIPQIQKMHRDKPDLTEKILIIDKTELVEEIAKKRAEYPDAIIDIALSDESQLAVYESLLKGNKVTPLIFKATGDFIQFDGVIAALRALHSEDALPALLRIYSVMAGEPFKDPPDAIPDDVIKFARRFIFNLPRPAKVPVDEIPKLNEHLVQLLIAA